MYIYVKKSSVGKVGIALFVYEDLDVLIHKALNHSNYGVYVDCSKDSSEIYIGEYRSLFLTLSGQCNEGMLNLLSENEGAH
jgi:hypothetical protein